MLCRGSYTEQWKMLCTGSYTEQWHCTVTLHTLNSIHIFYQPVLVFTFVSYKRHCKD